jgi:hypothetical protein
VKKFLENETLLLEEFNAQIEEEVWLEAVAYQLNHLFDLDADQDSDLRLVKQYSMHNVYELVSGNMYHDVVEYQRLQQPTDQL